MMPVPFEHNYFTQISVSRNFRITGDYIMSANKVVQKTTIKNFLMVVCDVDDTRPIEQNLVIRNLLIGAKKEHQHGF